MAVRKTTMICYYGNSMDGRLIHSLELSDSNIIKQPTERNHETYEPDMENVNVQVDRFVFLGFYPDEIWYSFNRVSKEIIVVSPFEPPLPALQNVAVINSPRYLAGPGNSVFDVDHKVIPLTIAETYVTRLDEIYGVEASAKIMDWAKNILSTIYTLRNNHTVLNMFLGMMHDVDNFASMFKWGDMRPSVAAISSAWFNITGRRFEQNSRTHDYLVPEVIDGEVTGNAITVKYLDLNIGLPTDVRRLHRHVYSVFGDTGVSFVRYKMKVAGGWWIYVVPFFDWVTIYVDVYSDISNNGDSTTMDYLTKIGKEAEVLEKNIHGFYLTDTEYNEMEMLDLDEYVSFEVNGMNPITTVEQFLEYVNDWNFDLTDETKKYFFKYSTPGTGDTSIVNTVLFRGANINYDGTTPMVKSDFAELANLTDLN